MILYKYLSLQKVFLNGKKKNQQHEYNLYDLINSFIDKEKTK